MLSNIQNIKFNNYNLISSNFKPKKEEINYSTNPSMLSNSLDCLASISFGSIGSLGSKVQKFVKSRFLTDLVSENIPETSSIYSFLRRYPKGFYMQCGKDVNNFLRSGEFEKLPTIEDDMPAIFKDYVVRQIQEKKDYNRTILESIDILDAQMTSRTTESITVYRDAPASWLKSAKDGILSDAGYLSTSTERGASLEGVLSNGADNMTYEIRVKSGTPYWDLTDSMEKEMLFPRGCQFRIVAPGVLEMI